MKALFYILLIIVLVQADNSKYEQLVQNFVKAISTGDRDFLEQSVHPTAIWSAPFQKILRGRTEIINTHQGLPDGHSLQTKNLEINSEGNNLQVFGLFDHIQNSQQVAHSGRFIAHFQANRGGIYQLTKTLWHLDGSHLKNKEQQKTEL